MLIKKSMQNPGIYKLSGAFFVTLIYDFSISRTPAAQNTG